MWRTGATLVFGAGLGAAASRLLSAGGRREEEGGAGLMSRVPVIPVPGVPTVQASELQVSVREVIDFRPFVCVCVLQKCLLSPFPNIVSLTR